MARRDWQKPVHTEVDTSEAGPGPLWLFVLPSEKESRKLMSAQVCGLPFLTRQMRLAKHAGAGEILVVSAGGSEDTIELVRNHPMNPEFSFADYDKARLRLADAATDGSGMSSCVVQHAAFVFDASDLGKLVSKAYMASPDCVVTAGGQERGALRLSQVDDVRETVLSICADSASQSPDPGSDNPLPIGHVHDVPSLAAVEQKLWARCRKSTDGIISTYINRNISLSLSKRLVSTTVTPNQITLIAFAAGIAGILLITTMGYWATLTGAILLNIGSIIDGVDGELARVRVQSSVLGEWLDTISDDAVSILFVLALGYRSSLTGSDPGVLLSLFTAASMTIVSGIYYKRLKDMGRGDILVFGWFENGDTAADISLLSKLYFLGGRLFRRDLFIASVFVLAVFDKIEWALLLAAPATALTLLAQLSELSKHKSPG